MATPFRSPKTPNPQSMKKLKHWLGFHDPINCQETGEIKFEYQNAFDLMITKYTEYKCDCGRKFWMPKGSFEEWKLSEITYRMTLNAVKMLKKQRRIEEAIELLKL